MYSKNEKGNKDEEAEFVKVHELIFLVEKARYTITNSREILRENDVEDLRFIVTPNVYELLIAELQKLKDIDETELG